MKLHPLCTWLSVWPIISTLRDMDLLRILIIFVSPDKMQLKTSNSSLITFIDIRLIICYIFVQQAHICQVFLWLTLPQPFGPKNINLLTDRWFLYRVIKIKLYGDVRCSVLLMLRSHEAFQASRCSRDAHIWASPGQRHHAQVVRRMIGDVRE